MRPKIKKHYAGFVPAYISHPLSKCAYYHCDKSRTYEGSRYCEEHGVEYTKECLEQPEGANVLPFRPETPTDHV